MSQIILNVDYNPSVGEQSIEQLSLQEHFVLAHANSHQCDGCQAYCTSAQEIQMAHLVHEQGSDVAASTPACGSCPCEACAVHFQDPQFQQYQQQQQQRLQQQQQQQQQLQSDYAFQPIASVNPLPFGHNNGPLNGMENPALPSTSATIPSIPLPGTLVAANENVTQPSNDVSYEEWYRMHHQYHQQQQHQQQQQEPYQAVMTDQAQIATALYNVDFSYSHGSEDRSSGSSNHSDGGASTMEEIAFDEDVGEMSATASSKAATSYPCPHPGCTKEFPKLSTVKAHLLIHKSERPYACDQCAWTFVRYHDRKRHMDRHQGKRYACIVCQNRFARQDAVTRHLRMSSGNPCAWLLKAKGLPAKKVAAGKIPRSALGAESEIVEALEKMDEEARQMRANRHLDMIRYVQQHS